MNEILLQRLIRDNPWWVNKDYRSEFAEFPKREIYEDLVKELEYRMIISLVGLRRTGKSTLLFQLLSKIQDDLIDPKKILFFSFDEKLQEANPDSLEMILNYYFDSIIKSNPRILENTVYIFLDEVQYVKHWQSVLKNFYDASSKIKFIISGSFSLKLINQDRESLAGRIFETYIAPLNFFEYLKLKYKLDELKQRISLKNTTEDEINDFDKKLFTEKYLDDFDDFILHGNFPETLSFNDIEKKFSYIENSVINKLIENDIPKIYKLNKKDELKTLAKCFIQDSSSIFEIKNLVEATGIKRNTMSKYINALEASFFLDIVPSAHRSFHKTHKTRKKAYVISPNFSAALLNLRKENPLLNQLMGKLVETYILQRIKENKDFKNIHFFRKGRNEIDFLAGDFLLQQKSELTYIEVKYQNKIQDADIKFLLKYLQENEIKKAYVISKNKLEVKTYDNGVKVFFIPALLLA